MKHSSHRPIHAKTITDFDRAHFHEYLLVMDASADGFGWEAIAQVLWQGDQPGDAEGIVADLLKRAKWMSHTGYKHLLVESKSSPTAALDNLVEEGAMAPEEREFLKSEAGQKYWPQSRH